MITQYLTFKISQHCGVNNIYYRGNSMRLYEFVDNWGVYGKPAPERIKTDGTQSPLTFQGNNEWQEDPDFFHKWFSRPYLTNGKNTNYMLPIKSQDSR